MEVWKDIPGYEGLYQASNMGRIKSLPKRHGGKNGMYRERIFKLGHNLHGYQQALLCKDGAAKRITVHRLVALTFIPNPENKPQINHINGIKTDNRVENLEWNTSCENQNHAFENGLKTKKSILQFDLHGNLINTYDSTLAAEKETRVKRQHITACCKGRQKSSGGYRWKYEENT